MAIETVDQAKAIISQPGFDPYSEAGQELMAQVKRPSPAFEYIMQLQSLQAQQTPGSAAGWQNQVNNPMNSAALQTAAQNYGQLNADSNAYEDAQKASGGDMAMLRQAVGAALAMYGAGNFAFGGGGYMPGAGGEGALSAGEFAANAGVGAPGAMEVGAVQGGAYPFGMGPEPTGIGTGNPFTTAGGVADTGYGANTLNANNSGILGSNPWGVGTADPSLSVGNIEIANSGVQSGTSAMPLNDVWGSGGNGPYAGLGELSTPQSLGYQGIGMDTSTSGLINQYAPMSQLSTGSSAWDAMINGGSAAAGGALAGAASLGPVAYLAKSLGISEAAALKVLGAGGGALLGSLNGSKPAGTTTTTQDIPDWLKPYAIDILNKGAAQTNAAPQDFSQSDALLKNVMAGTANPYSQQDNPYFEKTLNLALNDTQGRVNNQFRNSAFGGSANQELLARNLGDQANNLRFGQYKNAQDLYTTDLNRATNVATGMPQYSAQKTQSNFQPLLNQKSLLGFDGSQTSSPYFTNPTSGALYGGLLGSQLFGGK